MSRPFIPAHRISRRKVLQAGVAGMAGAALTALDRRLSAAPAASRSSRPPNILLIMTDQHDPGVTGCYGNKLVHTPNIDALASRSIVMENAYCNSPLCVPSRSAFTSGKYVSRTKIWNNECWLPSDDMPSIARIMTAAGYESVLCGKMHYDETRSQGFTKIGSFNNNFMTGLGRRRAADDTSINLQARDSRFAEFIVADHSLTLDHDRKVLARAVDFLSKRKPGDKPLFLVVGFLAPHFPITVPQPYYQPYAGKVPMPNIPPGHLDTLPLNYQQLRRAFGIVQTDPNKVQKGRDLYYGLTQ